MIAFLVEGDGDKKSLPILLTRAKGIKPEDLLCIDMKGRSNILRKEDGFEKTILRQARPAITHFFVLLDQTGPRAPYSGFADEVAGLNHRIKTLNAQHGFNISLFYANREFESWLVGGLRRGSTFCDLLGIRSIPGDTQAAPADPKAWLLNHRRMKRYDSNTQACLTKHFELDLARRRNNSLDKFLQTL